MMTLEEMKCLVEKLLPTMPEDDLRRTPFIEYLLIFYLKIDLDNLLENRLVTEIPIEFVKDSIKNAISRIPLIKDISTYTDEENALILLDKQNVLSIYNLKIHSHDDTGKICYFHTKEIATTFFRTTIELYFSFYFENDILFVIIKDNYEFYNSNRIFETINLKCNIFEIDRTLRKVELIILHREYERRMKEQTELLSLIRRTEMDL